MQDISIHSVPGKNAANPYTRLYLEALAERGIRVSQDFEPSNRWTKSLRRPGPAFVQFHWPEKLWRYRGETAWSKLRGVFGLRSLLRLIRKRGFKIIWTVHNLEHHEGTDPIDGFGYGLLARYADLLIFHCKYAIAQYQSCSWSRRSRARVVLMPHGNYDGVYRPRGRMEARLRLRIDNDKRVVGCVGQIRPYKGIELTVEAVARDEALSILIAGEVHERLRPLVVRWRARLGERLVLIDRRLSDDEFAGCIAASDTVVLPYSRSTGSGVLLAAWSLGRTVVASRTGYFEELVGQNPSAGALFNEGDAADLLTSLRQELSRADGERRAAAHAAAGRYPWIDCVEPVYRAVLDLASDSQSAGRL